MTLCAPRLIASDLDGTLLDNEGRVSACAREALESASAAGLDILIATARPPRWITRLVPDLPGSVIVAGNGAFRVDTATGAIKTIAGFTPDVTREIALRLASIPGIGLSAECAAGFWRDDAYLPAPAAGESDQDGTIAPLTRITHTAGKLLATTRSLTAERFHEDVRRAVGPLATLQISTGGVLAELSPPGVTKASALADLAQERGLGPEHVWAVGDMPNDLPMLAWAGAAFAVANAHKSVLEAAHAVVPANTSDGVAQLLDAAVRARRTWLLGPGAAV